MTVNFSPNIRIFAASLILEKLGKQKIFQKLPLSKIAYDYCLKFINNDKTLNQLANSFLQAKEMDYNGIFYDFIAQNNNVNRPELKEIINGLEKFIDGSKIRDLFTYYSKILEDVEDYNGSILALEAEKVLSFFKIKPDQLDIKINVHINLLDSPQRGKNYYNGLIGIISSALNAEQKIYWPNIRHELMHIILKNIFQDDLTGYKLDIPVGDNYINDNLRVKFDENFVSAANLFFLQLEKERQSNLKYFYDHGFKKIHKFYELIEKYFVKSETELSSDVLREFLKVI